MALFNRFPGNMDREALLAQMKDQDEPARTPWARQRLGGAAPVPYGPASTPTSPESGMATPQPMPERVTAEAPPVATPDTSKWDTDGYARPLISFERTGQAPPGFDQTKWSDPNKQNPKYVVGGVVAKFAPMVKDPATREAGLQQTLDTLRQLYGPQVQFNGKDKYTGIPGVGAIDAWQGASAGIYNPQYIDLDAEAGAGRGAPSAGPGAPGWHSDALSALAPTDMGTYEQLQARLQELLGGGRTFDREALIAQMTR